MVVIRLYGKQRNKIKIKRWRQCRSVRKFVCKIIWEATKEENKNKKVEMRKDHMCLRSAAIYLLSDSLS